MIFPSRVPSVFHFAMLVVVMLAGARDVLADLAEIGAEGWYTWRVDAADDAPNWCCWTNRRERYYGGGCNLDDRNRGFGSNDDGQEAPREMQIYVQMKDGQLHDMRTLSEFCPVAQ